MAQHFTVGGYPNPDPHYISPEEENAILEAEYAEREAMMPNPRTTWLVQYADQPRELNQWTLDWDVWCECDDKDEAFEEALRRRELGWAARVLPPEN